MAVDMEKLKKRAEEEEARQLARSAGGAKFWTADKGENHIRLLPPWTSVPEAPNRDQFFREIYIHFGVGVDKETARVFCCPAKSPHVEKTACPICAFVEKLRNSGVPSDAELANDMRAKQRFYSNVVVLDDPIYTDQDVADWQASQAEGTTFTCPFQVGETKIQVWTYGPMIWNDLMSIFMDSKVDVSDLQNGHNLMCKRTGEKLQTKYRVTAEWQPQPFELIGRALNEAIINLDALSPAQPEDVMLEAMQGIGSLPAAPTGAPRAPGLPGNGQPAPQQQRQLPAPTPQGNGQQQARPAPAPAPRPAQPAPQQAAPAPRPAAPAPAPKPAPAPQQAAPKPAPAPAPKPAQQSLPQAPPADAPACYLDKQTCDPQDAECVGGQKGTDVYDPCPYYGACHAAKFGAQEPERRGRRAAKRTEDAPVQQQSVDDLENEMRNSLKA